MQSFIEEILYNILQKQEAIENLVFVLPSKRAGTFLRNSIAKRTSKTIFSPEIYSIEAFVEKISGLTYANNTEQLFALYTTYLKNIPGEKDDFATFTKWAQTLLQDFNEIDRHLVDANAIFSNLSAILEINHWSPQNERTQMMEDYLRFWKHLEPLYQHFNRSLSSEGLGHQGLVYRKANENLDAYLSENQKIHIFMGFNALNTAESQIIQKMLMASQAKIYWDIDRYFLEDPIHDAGFFIRKYSKSWKYFETQALQGISGYYNSKKNIDVIGVPKNISQAKYVGHILGHLHSKDSETLEQTAIVLGDEALLNPVLNAIPQTIRTVNITMGYPLHKTPLANLFGNFIKLYDDDNADQGWYHQTIIDMVSNPLIHMLFEDKNANGATILSERIKTKNLSYLSAEKIRSLMQDTPFDFSFLFFENQYSPKQFVEKCLQLVLKLRDKIKVPENALILEHLYRFYKLFNQLTKLIQNHTFIRNLKSLQSLYRELLSSETLDFQGNPLEGLQIMGMLESRNLDFETVIITSVNEGILPSGKSNNSFIPFDLKAAFGLPTYKEKDAVYTYHFYRLLQRAKNIYILYNTEPDVLEGGEKSRFIMQLLTDENKSADISEIIATPKIISTPKTLQVISKDENVINLIKEHAKNGFSPSSLSNYIRNPIGFYKQYLLGIEDALEVEETVAANTFGTIVHNTLEELYTPLIGKHLTEKNLTNLKPKIKETVTRHFLKSYGEGDVTRGKNLIAFNVVLRYIENFINLEIRETKKYQIKILALEEKLNLEVNMPEIDFPIFLKGKLDRIDEVDGTTRIIDYKTGKVASAHVEIVDWPKIITDYDDNKAFQLLCYALMYQNKNNFVRLESGIISFKNLNSGLLKFATKEKKGSRIKDTRITTETLELFETQLKKLISEICNSQIPFTEKEP